MLGTPERDVRHVLGLAHPDAADLDAGRRENDDALARGRVEIAGAIHAEAVGTAGEPCDPHAGAGGNAAVREDGIGLDAVAARDVEAAFVR